MDEHQHSNEMAIDLFLNAAHTQPEANFVISPHSLFQALNLLFMGADGATQQLLQDYLGQASHYHEGMTVNADATPDDVLTHGAAMVLADGFEVQPLYESLLNDLSVNIHKGVDFNDQPSLQKLAEKLNDEICKLTHGMIQNFCNADRWSNQTLFIILTSVYFRGIWQTPLDAVEGYGTFTLPDQQKIHLKKVLKKELEHTHYAKYKRWQAVAVPYQENFEMVLILPPEGTLPHQANTNLLNKLLSRLSSWPVNLQMPPFETRTTHDMNPLLESAGLGGLFQTRGLSMGAMLVRPHRDLSLGQVTQQCCITVDEYGTTAAAATEMVMESGRTPRDVNFDRPFMYVLREKGTGRILFVGQLTNPEAIQ